MFAMLVRDLNHHLLFGSLFSYRYSKELELPHLPEMVFPNNKLILMHKSGIKVEFNALDALKLVSNGKNAVKVACSDSWKETR